MRDPFVSVIIPVLRDADALAALLEVLHPATGVEVIVAHGDARDPALEPVRRAWPAVQWVDGPRGRGPQMNAGGARAVGQWLLFLHADARLADGWLDEIRRAADAGAVGGCYRLKIDSPVWQARLIERGVRCRVRWLGIVYGDQGVFIRRDIFHTVSGYRAIPVMGYIEGLGIDRIRAWESELLAYGTERLLGLPGLRLIGTAKEKAAVLSFEMEGIHPHDVGTILDQQGIAVRAGHHCAQPVMERFGVPATTRASLAFYNTREEIDALVGGLEKVVEMFR